MHKNEIKNIYKEIDKKGEIYTEGFTPEQIYYQVEEKIKEMIEDSEKVVTRMCSRIERERKDEVEGEEDREQVDDHDSKEEDEDHASNEEEEDHASNVGEQVDDHASNVGEQVDDHDSNEKEKDHASKQEDDNDSNEDDSSNSSPLRIENVGTDYSDCSSIDESTYSQDSTPFDPEDLKSKPASELFKTLDKNIRRTK